MNDSIAVQSETVVDASIGNAANLAEALGSCSATVPATEIAFLVAGIFVCGSFDVERIPIVNIGELEDGAVEAVFCVPVDAAGFGEANGEVTDMGIGEVLAS